MSVGVLLDANVLIALTVTTHVHHDAAEEWFARRGSFATCPVTQGALVRFLLRVGVSAREAVDVLRGVTGDPRHAFWADDRQYVDVDLRGVVGHRQVTDAYLADLARTRGGRLATLDGGLAALHHDVALLVGR